MDTSSPPASASGRSIGLRNWRVRSKLIAVLVIPAVAFLVLASFGIGALVGNAQAFEEGRQLAELGRQVTALVHELQTERDLSVAFTATADKGVGKTLGEQRPRVNQAAADYREAEGELYDDLGGFQELSGLLAQQQAAFDAFQADANDQQRGLFADLVQGQAVLQVNSIQEEVIRTQSGEDINGPQWLAASTTNMELLRGVETRLLDGVIGQSGDLSADARRDALRNALLIALILGVALLALLLVARSMARPLQQLRAGAIEIAQRRLPDAVQRLRTTERGDLDVRVEPIGIRSEDVIVLSGADPGRHWAQPMTVVDVVRAAAAEVEEYQRVELLPLADLEVAGHVAVDVIHLLAELIENATAFSPPNTKVQIAGQAVPHGYVIEVEDRGLGMSDEELIQANERLANPPEIDFALSRVLGLYVVGRLAQRHGIKIQLRHSWYGGVTALTLLPNALLLWPKVPQVVTA